MQIINLLLLFCCGTSIPTNNNQIAMLQTLGWNIFEKISFILDGRFFRKYSSYIMKLFWENSSRELLKTLWKLCVSTKFPQNNFGNLLNWLKFILLSFMYGTNGITTCKICMNLLWTMNYKIWNNMPNYFLSILKYGQKYQDT